MENRINSLKNQVINNLKLINNVNELEDFRVSILGKKGELSEIMSDMRNLSKEDKPVIGQLANKARDFITIEIQTKMTQLKQVAKREQIEKETIDISLPGKQIECGRFHPITETLNFLKNIFITMGFDVAAGPELENVYNNFDALNIPVDHPSRSKQDTFFIDNNTVLRTHTSPVQIRYMQKKELPFRMVCPGKVYRPDYDISHTPMFHQMEGLMIGKNISFANLKGVLTEFVNKVFGETNVRFRPHFFPFTEPSAEIDVECIICKGAGCRLCKHSGWLEIMGCGMVDPEVLKNVGHDPEIVSGFAFGMGIERISMLRHGIDDLRVFYENDMRFLKQFRF